MPEVTNVPDPVFLPETVAVVTATNDNAVTTAPDDQIPLVDASIIGVPTAS